MKLLATGAFAWTRNELRALEALGHSVVFMQNESEPLPIDAAQIEGVICNGLFLSHSIEDFTSLKFIQLTSAGFDRVPMDYVRARGIRIFNARGVYSVPMAEFAICGALQLMKRSAFFAANQRARRWEKRRDLLELCGKTVCVVGCGSVGTECAKRFKAFGCRVVGVDLFPRENEFFDETLPLTALDDALASSDVVLLTLPPTEESRGLMNAERFAKTKPGAILINIARGAIVETSALIDALQNGLGGAVLDVFEEEPLPEDSPLWRLENVVVTPHNSFVGDGNRERLTQVIVRNLSLER